jgi:hypothetical protein
VVLAGPVPGSLQHLLNEDQRVLAALDYTTDNDTSPKVRTLARWEFLDEPGRREYVRSTLLNDGLSPTDRFELLVADLADLHYYIDLQTALTALSHAANAVDARGESASRAERESVDYQQMVPMLIEALEDDDNQQVRVTAASMLIRYADDPAVRGALENAASSDQSPMLRLFLSRSLQR